MLRAIELSGFKSFADRTRLEFEGGISALVGPNGSGKSNIVDAVKWVLGEQSMKKLRGTEATDVIFNGSAGRAALETAEVTLTFDNSTGIFDLDTPEVHITRRVYRNGKGEYLINRQGSLLKDIKDLLSGTGLGTQAYSIIEQGRVESLLNSSSVQRRVIFEEAAGISRFNARKQESQKRLERVEQNLIRLSDLVAEKENQLRTSRNQAGKAQLFRQYSTRLRELRIAVTLSDYRKRSTKTEKLQKEVETLTEELDRLGTNIDANEKRLADFNAKIEEIDVEIRRIEGEIATTRQRISGEESTIRLQTTQVEELDAEIALNGRQLVELNLRSVDIEDMMRKTIEDIRKAKRSTADIQQSYEKLLDQSEQLAAVNKTKAEEKDNVRKEIEAKSRRNAELNGAVVALESKMAALEQTERQNSAKLELLEKQKLELLAQREELSTTIENLEDAAVQKKNRLEEAKQRKSDRRIRLTDLVQDLSDVKQKSSAMRERISLLEELIRKNEGLSPGVKDVLLQSRDPDSPFHNNVFGLVADLLRVDVDAATLIELALGANAQYLVVSPKGSLFRHIIQNRSSYAGRVGFIWLDPNNASPPWMKEKRFQGRNGVLGRADQFVNTDAPFQHLAGRLLGRTWIVENFSTARKLYDESDARTSFLTLSGEMLSPDGALVVGPVNSSSGLITRRSELRTLTEQMQVLNQEVYEREVAVAVAREHALNDESDVEEETREYQNAVAEYEAARRNFDSILERYTQTEQLYVSLQDEMEKQKALALKTRSELELSLTERAELDERLQALEIRQIELRHECEKGELNNTEHQRKVTNAKIELAKSEERLDFLNERIRQFEDHLKERQEMLAEHHRRSRSLQSRRDSILLAILHIESTLASLFLKKEDMAAQVTKIYQKRHEWAEQRGKLQADHKRTQHELQKLRSKIHSREIELERCSQEQKNLLDRMQEDYNIDLTAYESEVFIPTAPTVLEETEIQEESDQAETSANDSSDPAEQSVSEETVRKTDLTEEELKSFQKEIDELKNKLQRIGNVNLDSIETLDELEKQYQFYSTQYADLIESRRSIEKIIERINVESRQLFEETFEGVRGHFRDLFQHLFGGGSADLVLEDPTNILESGVDIIAKPPGKELKSVTLLSGGEKTMTCVALLLAFFRFRPNPVCILDECDAALDEGNIDRFVRVIKEFGTLTQFLMITHSKKTMAAAETMYGVTMQESGVSKPISVRFAEVGENGEILARDHNAAA